jgi:hypothetical protein
MARAGAVREAGHRDRSAVRPAFAFPGAGGLSSTARVMGTRSRTVQEVSTPLWPRQASSGLMTLRAKCAIDSIPSGDLMRCGERSNGRAPSLPGTRQKGAVPAYRRTHPWARFAFEADLTGAGLVPEITGYRKADPSRRAERDCLTRSCRGHRALTRRHGRGRTLTRRRGGRGDGKRQREFSELSWLSDDKRRVSTAP